jgi:hypothetical protein
MTSQAETMTKTVFWVVATCCLVQIYRRFRGAYCLHNQGNDECSEHLWNVGKLPYTCKTTRRNNPEDSHLHTSRSENLKSHEADYIWPIWAKLISPADLYFNPQYNTSSKTNRVASMIRMDWPPPLYVLIFALRTPKDSGKIKALTPKPQTASPDTDVQLPFYFTNF